MNINGVVMGKVIKVLFFMLIGVILLLLIVPLGYLLIQLVSLIAGGIFVSGGDILTVLFIIGCIVFIIWCFAS